MKKEFRPIATKNITNYLIAGVSLIILFSIIYVLAFGFYNHLILLNTNSFIKLLYVIFITLLFIFSAALILYQLGGQKIVFESNSVTSVRRGFPYMYDNELIKVDLSKVEKAIFHKRFASSIYKYYRGFPNFYYAIKFIHSDKSELLFYFYNWRWFDVDQIQTYLKDNYKNIEVVEEYDKIYDDYPNKYY